MYSLVQRIVVVNLHYEFIVVNEFIRDGILSSTPIVFAPRSHQYWQENRHRKLQQFAQHLIIYFIIMSKMRNFNLLKIWS